MAKKFFSDDEWDKISQQDPGLFGLPARSDKSVIFGSFNIREFGNPDNLSEKAFSLIARICKNFDLLAIQEVGDDLSAVKKLKDILGEDFGWVVSDVTGIYPGARGNAERLAFLFNWKRIERTELASDITIDRSRIYETLLENRLDICRILNSHKGKASTLSFPQFISFVRTPYCASFRVKAKGHADPIEFLAVNAHLLYGSNKEERALEFFALIEWLCIRAKKSDRTYHKNLLLLGDCNLDFDNTANMRVTIDEFLKNLNSKVLKSKKAAKANFPLLTNHPQNGEIRTSARFDDTYDQIGLFHHDQRLPDYSWNSLAGTKGADGFDYGVFRFTDMIAQALYGETFVDLDKKKKKYIIERSEWDISDHLPVWMRIKIPVD